MLCARAFKGPNRPRHCFPRGSSSPRNPHLTSISKVVKSLFYNDQYDINLKYTPTHMHTSAGEACVKCDGKERALGAHAPTRGLRQKSPYIRSYTVYIWFWPTLCISHAHTHTHTFTHARTCFMDRCALRRGRVCRGAVCHTDTHGEGVVPRNCRCRAPVQVDAAGREEPCCGRREFYWGGLVSLNQGESLV